MLSNWTEQLTNTKNASAGLASANPKLLTAYQGLNAAQNGNGALDAKTRELIALAVAVATRCDSCIASHVNMARQAGVAYVYSLRVTAMARLCVGPTGHGVRG